MNLKIALRFIRKNIIQSFIIFFAVALGVAAMFFIFSIGSTLEEMILEQTTAYQEHIIIQKAEKKVSQSSINHDIPKEILRNNSEVTNAFYRTSFSGNLTNDNSLYLNFELILSNSDTNYHESYGIGNIKYLKSGRISDPKKQEIMLNDYFAKQNGIKAGDQVTFNYKNEYHFVLDVTGTYDLGLFRVSNNYAYASLDLFETDTLNEYSIIVQVENPKLINKTKDKLTKYISEHKESRVDTWQDLNPDGNLLNLAQVAVILVIDIFILLAVFVVVVNMLNHSIKQKYMQLGILKAMGMQNGDINKVFTIQTLILSIPGLIIGLFSGSIIMNEYHNFMVYPDGTHRFNLLFLPKNYILSVMTIVLTILLANLLTIKRLKKSTIIEMIKT